MKYKEDQPEGYPLNITFTDGGTKAVRNSLEEKLNEIKDSLNNIKTKSRK